MDKYLEKSIKAAGGLRKLSRRIGVAHQAIGKWTRIPAERVMDIEAVIGVPRSVIRPDIYPPNREKK